MSKAGLLCSWPRHSISAFCGSRAAATAMRTRLSKCKGGNHNKRQLAARPDSQEAIVLSGSSEAPLRQRAMVEPVYSQELEEGSSQRVRARAEMGEGDPLVPGYIVP